MSGWWSKEPVFWVTGDEANDPGNESAEDEMLISRPAYPNVPRGWICLDPWNNCALPLTDTVFWDRVAHEPELRYRDAQPA